MFLKFNTQKIPPVIRPGLGNRGGKYCDKRTDIRHDSINESIYFKIHGPELLSPLADIFLSDHKKILPLDIEKYLSPEAFNPLAELFLDQNKKTISTDLIKNHLTPRGLA